MPWISRKEAIEWKQDAYEMAVYAEPFIKKELENTDKEKDGQKYRLLKGYMWKIESIKERYEKKPLNGKTAAQIILSIEWAILIVLQIAVIVAGWT